MNFLQIILTGIILGIAFSAPPGAVTAESIRRGVDQDFWGAVSVGLGSIIGDLFYAALALGGLSFLVANLVARTILGLGGGALLLFLAYQGLRSTPTVGQISVLGVDQSVASDKSAGHKSAFISGLAISMTNPWAIAFWVSIGGAMLSAGLVDPTLADIAFFFTGYIGGTILWVFILSALIAFGRRTAGPRFFRFLSIISSVALGVLGITLVVKTLAS
ncbi:MAG: hypothetical protein EXR62_05980 [Chloroflexi bacterium]|nr:hypothetical protein [Chloroflexota bacterium]